MKSCEPIIAIGSVNLDRLSIKLFGNAAERNSAWYRHGKNISNGFMTNVLICFYVQNNAITKTILVKKRYCYDECDLTIKCFPIELKLCFDWIQLILNFMQVAREIKYWNQNISYSKGL